MQNETQCSKCNSQNIYFDGTFWICPECGNEWMPHSNTAIKEETLKSDPDQIVDAYGNALASGDTITVIKELKIKGSSSAVKVGTKVKNIRLGDAGDGHNISCKIEGLGSINLKSEYVKKS